MPSIPKEAYPYANGEELKAGKLDAIIIDGGFIDGSRGRSRLIIGVQTKNGKRMNVGLTGESAVALAAAFGSDDSDKWTGKPVQLAATEYVIDGKKMLGVLVTPRKS